MTDWARGMEIFTTSCSPPLHTDIFCTIIHLGHAKGSHEEHLHHTWNYVRNNKLHFIIQHQYMLYIYEIHKNNKTKQKYMKQWRSNLARLNNKIKDHMLDNYKVIDYEYVTRGLRKTLPARQPYVNHCQSGP